MCLVSHAGSRDDAFLPCRHHRPSPRNVTHTHPTTFFLFKFGPPSRVQHISIKTRPRIAFVHEMKRKLAKFQKEFFFPESRKSGTTSTPSSTARKTQHFPFIYISTTTLSLSLCVCVAPLFTRRFSLPPLSPPPLPFYFLPTPSART